MEMAGEWEERLDHDGQEDIKDYGAKRENLNKQRYLVKFFDRNFENIHP